MPVRIALLDDDPGMLKKLEIIIDGEKEFQVVGSYASPIEALDSLPEPYPDIFLVDLDLPEISGIEFIRQLKKVTLLTEVIVYTVAEDKDTILSALQAGASGYILKSGSGSQLLSALKDASEGGVPLSHAVSRAFLDTIRETKVKENFGLSDREKEILLELSKGLSYQEVADSKHIGKGTVNFHVTNIYKKLNAGSRIEAMKIAMMFGLI